MSYIASATEEIAKYFHAGMLVILESTTYPGTTDELVRPMLERDGLRVGEDFFLCFSPERVDPGNPNFQTKNIPKVVGGTTAECTRMGALFYSQALEKVVPVSSTQVAEMVKLLENTFRMINIGLVNELAIMCGRMGINVWEVIDAAARFPFRQAASQIALDTAGSLVTILGCLGEQFHDDRRDGRWDTLDPLPWRHGLSGNMAVHPFHRIRGGKRQSTSEHLVKGDSERVEIAAGID